MSPTVTPLPWDSDFFGVRIGRVALDDATGRDLATIDDQARDLGLACLYGSLDPIDVATTITAQVHGWRLVEVGTWFELKVTEPPIPRPPDTTFRLGTVDDISRVAHVVDRMAPWSRYAVDPRFGLDAARRMQHAWLERAARATDGVHSLSVAESEGEIIAFVGRSTEPSPRVDAVGTTRQGSGAARFLSQEARDWAGDRALLGGPIAARNIAGIRYATGCGYRVNKVEYTYHRWLDETPA